jgi:hypothetical protein
MVQLAFAIAVGIKDAVVGYPEFIRLWIVVQAVYDANTRAIDKN